MALSSLASAQIEQISIVIADYDSSKIIPGGTVDVSFTLYKPAGIETEGKLYTWMYYYEGSTSVFVHKWYYEGAPETSTDISWGPEERQESFTLPLVILDNAPIGESVYLGVSLRVECNYNLIDVDNNGSFEADKDNIVITVDNENFNWMITYIREYPSYTWYYFASGKWVFTGPTSYFIVTGGNTDQILAPPFDLWLTIALVAAGSAAAIAVGLILVKKRRMGKSKQKKKGAKRLR